EFASRHLLVLGGLLAIALIFRVGRAWFGVYGGLGAAAVLGTSVYFITYMHKFRVYTIAAAAFAATLWFYGQLMDKRRSPRPPDVIGLGASATVFVYSNYFAAMPIFALGLWHLLFARKTRHWWFPVVAALMALVAFAPQGITLLRGLAFIEGKADLLSEPLSPAGIVWSWWYYFSHGQPWLLLLSAAAGGIGLWRMGVSRQFWLVLWLMVVGFLPIVAANEVSSAFQPERIRYLIGLWVPGALLVGAGIGALWAWRRPAGLVVLGLWVGVGAWATLDDTLMRLDAGDEKPPLAWRETRAIIDA
ncbi:MAG: glycosyltransferase family 39 protein, partial [Chloroflexota bacterium]